MPFSEETVGGYLPSNCYSHEEGGNYAYEYDNEERITKVTDSIDGVYEYTYDALGQLLTENTERSEIVVEIKDAVPKQ